MLTDSRGTAARLFLEPMPELKRQETLLDFILKVINISHTLTGKQLCLWDLSDAVPAGLGTASSTAGAQAEVGSSWLTVQGLWGDVILQITRGQKGQLGKPVVRYYSLTMTDSIFPLYTRHQILSAIWRSLKIPQSKRYRQYLWDFSKFRLYLPQRGDRGGKYGSKIKKLLYFIWMPGSSFFKTELYFNPWNAVEIDTKFMTVCQTMSNHRKHFKLTLKLFMN